MGLIDRLFGTKTTRPTLDVPAGGRPTPKGQETEEDVSWRPPKCPGNPGVTAGGRVAFANGERRWPESFDLIRIAVGVLHDRGHEVAERETWLELRPSAFILQPLLVQIQPLEKGGVQTLTTIDVRHPDLIKEGLFEYQHSTGDNVAESLTKGFESWESVDLPVLIDALRPKTRELRRIGSHGTYVHGRPLRLRSRPRASRRRLKEGLARRTGRFPQLAHPRSRIKHVYF